MNIRIMYLEDLCTYRLWVKVSGEIIVANVPKRYAQGLSKRTKRLSKCKMRVIFHVFAYIAQENVITLVPKA